QLRPPFELGQREHCSEGESGRGEGGARLQVSPARECPVQRGTNILDRLPVNRKPLLARCRVPVGLSGLQQLLEVGRVASAKSRLVLTVYQLRECIGSRDMRQSETSPLLTDIRREQRLVYQGNETIDHIRCRQVRIGHDGNRGVHRERPTKYRQALQSEPLV